MCPAHLLRSSTGSTRTVSSLERMSSTAGFPTPFYGTMGSSLRRLNRLGPSARKPAPSTRKVRWWGPTGILASRRDATASCGPRGSLPRSMCRATVWAGPLFSRQRTWTNHRSYLDPDNKRHGFLLSDGVYTTIDVPGAVLTAAETISDAGELVGFFLDANVVAHGFLLSKGILTQVDVPARLSPRSSGSTRKARSWAYTRTVPATTTASLVSPPAEPSRFRGFL